MIARFNPQAEDLQRFQVGPNRGGIDHQTNSWPSCKRSERTS
jgi:hypothetical protein